MKCICSVSAFPSRINGQRLDFMSFYIKFRIIIVRASVFSSVACDFFVTISDVFPDNFKIFKVKPCVPTFVNAVKEVLN